jgi:hypothetical protein
MTCPVYPFLSAVSAEVDPVFQEISGHPFLFICFLILFAKKSWKVRN